MPNSKIVIINIYNINGKKKEMVEIMKARNLSVLGFCETRIKGNRDIVLHGNYKLIFSGRDDGRHGVLGLDLRNSV